MKTLILFASLITINAWAGDCKISVKAAISKTNQCKRFDVVFTTRKVEECVAIARSTQSNQLFNLLEKNDRVVKANIDFHIPLNPKSQEIFFDDPEKICL